MGKKILFAVMALLVMVTGKIWAQTPYAVLCPNEGGTTYSMHFVYTTATEKTVEGGEGEETEKTVNVTINGTTTPITLTEKNAWEITNTNPNGWQSGTNKLTAAEKGSITEVVFEESFKTVKVTSCYNWFNGFTKLENIVDIKHLDTSEVTDMVSMFSGCSGLTTLNLSSFNTSEAANTASMFRECSNLGKITFGNNFKTKNTESMFQDCKALTTLDGLSSFNTSQVGNMSFMFNGCSSLTSLDLSSFNTSGVKYMNNMFEGCSSLTSLDLSSFVTSKVEDMSYMFKGCSGLTSLDLSSFDMSGVTHENYMEGMFLDCTNLKMLDLSNVTTAEDITKIIGKLPAESNPVIFISKNIEKPTTDKNIVAEGETCEEFVIDANNLTSLNIPYNFKAKTITFTRKFTEDKPHTVCLPFAITNTTEYGTFYELSGYDNGKVKFKKVNETKWNTPYLFIPKTAGVTEIKVTGNVDISSTVSGGYAWGDRNTQFYGVYEKKIFTKAEEDEGIYYGWTAEGDFKRAGEGASVAPCRAYIKLKKETTDIGGSSDNAPARLSVEFDDGETTGIDTIGTANGGADAPMYNLQGQHVGSGYKGVVIKNGKKMIVR